MGGRKLGEEGEMEGRKLRGRGKVGRGRGGN